MINPHELNNNKQQEEQIDDIISNEQPSRLFNWNPLNTLNLFKNTIDNEQLLDDKERKLFQNLNLKREYVYIRNNSIKIWTVSCNQNSPNTPIVLIHGYCGGLLTN
jgi:hypothetical protein